MVVPLRLLITRSRLMHTSRAIFTSSSKPPPPPPPSNHSADNAAATKTALPAPGTCSTNRGDDVTPLPVGSSASLDALGPLVVNVDGSLGRVANWPGMTAAEREGTLRLLKKRNAERLAALKGKREREGDGEGEK